MKEYFRYTILVVCILASTEVLGCEICGCSHSNFQIGLLPYFNKGFVGTRYTMSRFNSRVKDDASEFSRDYYQSLEVWGGYNFNRFQVMVFVPYVFSRKVSDDGTTYSNGAGDIMTLINYKILNKTTLGKSEKTTIRQELYLGAGFKLPTGVNDVDTADPDFNIGDFNSQSGTGSFDYLINATYNFMWNNSGVVTNLAYRMNTSNEQDYKFGNRMYVNSSYYYTLSKGKTRIIPNAGVNYQHNAINTFQRTEVEDSNGYTLSAAAGVNVIHHKFGVNVTTFIPVAQNNFDGQTRLASRVMAGVTYSF